jgi:hypothetical protein
MGVIQFRWATMDQRFRYILGLLLAFGVGALCAAGVLALRSQERVTLVALSPDDTTRIWLVELAPRLDRNFELRIENLERPGMMQTVFKSPDEGRPIGSERVLWSADGRQLILVGRHFIVEPNAVLPEGEQLYLLYSLDTGELRCNARQAKYPRITIDEARALGGTAGGI